MFLPFVPFSVKLYISFDNLILVMVWTNYFKFVTTDFRSSSCVIWHTWAYFLCFYFIRMASRQPAFHWQHFWWNYGKQWMKYDVPHPSLLCQVLAAFVSCFLKTWLSDTIHQMFLDLLLYLFVCPQRVHFPYLFIFKNTLHAMLRYVKF